MQYNFNGQDVSEEEFNALLEESQYMMQAQEREIAEHLAVSSETASAIMYLRTRSRWTLQKETELIERDKAGNPISLNKVLSGEF